MFLYVQSDSPSLDKISVLNITNFLRLNPASDGGIQPSDNAIIVAYLP